MGRVLVSMVWLELMRSRPTVDGEVGVVLLLVLIAVRVCEVEMFWLQDVGCLHGIYSTLPAGDWSDRE